MCGGREGTFLRVGSLLPVFVAVSRLCCLRPAGLQLLADCPVSASCFIFYSCHECQEYRYRPLPPRVGLRLSACRANTFTQVTHLHGVSVCLMLACNFLCTQNHVLSQLPKCWDFRNEPPHPTHIYIHTYTYIDTLQLPI